VSLFTTQLQNCLESTGISRRALAEKSGLPYNTLSNYATESRTPDIEAMRAICTALPIEQRAALIIARLADETPAEYRHLIILSPKKTALSQVDDIANQVQMPASLRADLDAIGAAAIESENWRVVVARMADALIADAFERQSSETTPNYTAQELAAARAAAKDRPRSA
jgi:transcriptional regulator with XRE-family HTH domain